MHRVVLHSCQECRVIVQSVFDGEEHSRSVEPESADNRHEVREVRDLVTEARKEAGESDVEDRLQDHHRDHQNDSPRDLFQRWGDCEDDHHDQQGRHEVKEIADHGGDRERCTWELEALDHGRTGTDRSGSASHALTCVTEEEYADDEEPEEVVNTSRGPQDVTEDEPEREHRKQWIEEQPPVAEYVLPRRARHLGSGLGDDEVAAVPQRGQVAAQARPSTDGHETFARHGRDRTQPEGVLRLTHRTSLPTS